MALAALVLRRAAISALIVLRMMPTVSTSLLALMLIAATEWRVLVIEVRVELMVELAEVCLTPAPVMLLTAAH